MLAIDVVLSTSMVTNEAAITDLTLPVYLVMGCTRVQMLLVAIVRSEAFVAVVAIGHGSEERTVSFWKELVMMDLEELEFVEGRRW